MQALVRVQAHMLARIVVDAGIAVELEPYGIVFCDVFDADNAHYHGSFLFQVVFSF